MLSLLFWGFLASFIIHILDEALLGGGFVQWIVDNFWPTYRMRMFFWFNAAFLGAIAVSNMLFDSFGDHWIILPLIWMAGFVIHALTVHVYWTLRHNTHSPGLLTSLLYVIIFYLLIISLLQFLNGALCLFQDIDLLNGKSWLDRRTRERFNP